jgi:hypothetical protein
MKQLDASFFDSQPTGTGRSALRVLGSGAADVGLTILAVLLYLPMRLLGFLTVMAVLSRFISAWVFWHYNHDAFSASMSLLMVPVVLFVAGALLKFRNWLFLARMKWS